MKKLIFGLFASVALVTLLGYSNAKEAEVKPYDANIEKLATTLSLDKDFQELSINTKAEMAEMISVFKQVAGDKKVNLISESEKNKILKKLSESGVLLKARKNRLAILSSFPELKSLSTINLKEVFREAIRKIKSNSPKTSLRFKYVTDSACAAACEATYYHDINELELYFEGEQVRIETEYTECKSHCSYGPELSSCLTACEHWYDDANFLLAGYINGRSNEMYFAYMYCDYTCPD